MTSWFRKKGPKTPVAPCTSERAAQILEDQNAAVGRSTAHGEAVEAAPAPPGAEGLPNLTDFGRRKKEAAKAASKRSKTLEGNKLAKCDSVKAAKLLKDVSVGDYILREASQRVLKKTPHAIAVISVKKSGNGETVHLPLTQEHVGQEGGLTRFLKTYSEDWHCELAVKLCNDLTGEAIDKYGAA